MKVYIVTVSGWEYTTIQDVFEKEEDVIEEVKSLIKFDKKCSDKHGWNDDE